MELFSDINECMYNPENLYCILVVITTFVKAKQSTIF